MFVCVSVCLRPREAVLAVSLILAHVGHELCSGRNLGWRSGTLKSPTKARLTGTKARVQRNT